MLDVLKVLRVLSQTMQRDDLTSSQLSDALTTAHLSLVELSTTNGKNVSTFLSEVRDDTYHDISLRNVEADETYGNVKQKCLPLFVRLLKIDLDRQKRTQLFTLPLKLWA